MQAAGWVTPLVVLLFIGSWSIALRLQFATLKVQSGVSRVNWPDSEQWGPQAPAIFGRCENGSVSAPVNYAYAAIVSAACNPWR